MKSSNRENAPGSLGVHFLRMSRETSPWRLDLSPSGRGWLLVRSGDNLAEEQARRAIDEAGLAIAGRAHSLVDISVGPCWAYPVLAQSD